uniref:Uncharacterized protein n=1 Tax=Rhipicephalus zambeziensis TaxID=60191 RepID=A0A224YB16_9ACAR
MENKKTGRNLTEALSPVLSCGHRVHNILKHFCSTVSAFDTLETLGHTHTSICIKRSDTGAYEGAPSISSGNGCVDHFPHLHISSHTLPQYQRSLATPNQTLQSHSYPFVHGAQTKPAAPQTSSALSLKLTEKKKNTIQIGDVQFNHCAIDTCALQFLNRRTKHTKQQYNITR